MANADETETVGPRLRHRSKYACAGARPDAMVHRCEWSASASERYRDEPECAWWRNAARRQPEYPCGVRVVNREQRVATRRVPGRAFCAENGLLPRPILQVALPNEPACSRCVAGSPSEARA